MSTTLGGTTGSPAASSAPTPARAVESRDPATGDVWHTFAASEAAAVRAAAAAARVAQPAWARESTRARARVMERFRRVLVARRAEVADTIRRENGKPAVEATVAEIMVTLDMARFLARKAPRCPA